MNIKGIIKNSFLDWDGKISTIVFTGDCNFRCPFCHNRNLVLFPDDFPIINENVLFDYLIRNKKWIDGVVITGGEPTLNLDLIDFIKKIKELGFLVKLDTNGFKPDIIKNIINLKIIDYIAMDIKTSLIDYRYSKATGIKNIDIENIIKSINFISNSNIDFEFRTTLCPSFVDLDDLKNIATLLQNKKWIWQNFRNSSNVLDPNIQNVNPYTSKELDLFEHEIKKNLRSFKVLRR